MVHFDDIFGYVGECGRYQLWHFFLLCLTAIPCAWHVYLNAFTFVAPPHRCRLPLPDDAFDVNASSPEGAWIERLIPQNDSCHTFSFNGTYPNFTVDSNFTVACTDFVYDRKYFAETVATTLNLVCARKEDVPFADSMVFVGALIGSVVIGSVSDQFGRQSALMFSLTGLLGVGVGTAFAKASFVGVVVLRTASSAFGTGVFMCAFVLGMETMGPNARTYAGVVIEFFFAAGGVLLAAVAYCIRDWVWLQLAVSIPVAVFLAFYFVIDESPRWLLSKAKVKKFEKTVQKMARWNRKTLPSDFVSSLEDEAFEAAAERRTTASCLDLFRFPNIAFKSVNLFFGWMVSTMLYYGITMSMTALPGDPFLQFLISSAVEIPAYILCLLILTRFGRRFSLAGSMILAGVACCVCPFVNDDAAETGLAITGKFFISISFTVIYIFTGELFPTPVRTVGIGLCSMFARLGGILFPYVLSAFATPTHPEAPLLVFGVAAVASGGFLTALPETLGKVLPETLAEADAFGRPRCCGGGGGAGRNGGRSGGGGAGGGGALLVDGGGGERRALLSGDEDEDDEVYSRSANAT